jgi:hypothetical protein
MGIRGKHFVMLALAGAILAGCSVADRMRPKKGIFFEGHQFRARAEQVGEEREDFQVTVHRVSQSIEGARQAGAYEAVRYCIKEFGASDATWTVGPESEGLTVVDDTLTLRGRCKGW